MKRHAAELIDDYCLLIAQQSEVEGLIRELVGKAWLRTPLVEKLCRQMSAIEKRIDQLRAEGRDRSGEILAEAERRVKAKRGY